MIPLLQKKMIFLTLTASASPSLTMIKFSSLDNSSHYKIMVNYNGQADLLLSLQIPPDYYPYQFKQRSLYDYLTNINKYIIADSKTSNDKQDIGKKIQERINELISNIKEFGPSLWNEDLYEGGLVTKNEQMWSSKKTDYLFLEQFILDDSASPLYLAGTLPKHKNLIVTNFRAARDPYTLFNEEVYKYFLNKSKNPNSPSAGTASQESNNHKLASKIYEYYKKYSKLKPNTLYRTAKYMDFWNSFCNTLDNLQQNRGKEANELGELKNFISLPKQNEAIFSTYSDIKEKQDSKSKADKEIAELFETFIFDDEEKEILKEFVDRENGFKINYLNNGISKVSAPENNSICKTELNSSPGVLAHHPALEHSTMPGSSPVSEGTQKDLMVYLAQIATSLYNISQSNEFAKDFEKDFRKQYIENALKNALSIVNNYKERLKKIREFLQSAKIVDSNFDPEKGKFTKDQSKSVAIISYPPAQLGAGNSTIQTVSKYPFLYRELGLKEVLPNSLGQAAIKQVSSHTPKLNKDIFGVDDNGWWWNLGDFNFEGSQLSEFEQTADSIIFVATEDDWNILKSDENPKLEFLKRLLKNETQATNSTVSSKFSYSNYHLWNEGLRSPIALNLLLDNLVDLLVKQFGINVDNGNNGAENLKQKYQEALDWGNYWKTTFINKNSVVNESK